MVSTYHAEMDAAVQNSDHQDIFNFETTTDFVQHHLNNNKLFLIGDQEEFSEYEQETREFGALERTLQPDGEIQTLVIGIQFSRSRTT